MVTWDSDGSLDSDGSSDDGKKSIKKVLASITINNKPSIFDTPSTCLMAKPTKVKYDVSDDDCESDDCRSDEHTCFKMKRKECKELRKKIKSLEQSFHKLNASHESLREDHEMLGKAHSKLEKAHSSILKQVKGKKPRKSK